MSDKKTQEDEYGKLREELRQIRLERMEP